MDAEMIDADESNGISEALEPVGAEPTGDTAARDAAAGDTVAGDAAAGDTVAGDVDVNGDVDVVIDAELVDGDIEVSAAEATAAADSAASAVEHDIDALVAERDQYRDIALRLQADFENYRKRISAQGDAEVDRATGKLAESLLPVLDACEAGVAHAGNGIEPIWSALFGALQRQGLEAMDLQDKPFDPAHAEAVIHEEGDGGEPIVAEVMRTGYLWKGKVLRAAMVKVRG